MRFIFFIFSMLFPLLCTAEGTPVTLENGKIIKWLGISHLHNKPTKTDIYVYRYETEIDLNNVGPLTEEANQVWKIFKPTVKKTKYDHAMVRACTKNLAPPPRLQRNCYNFIWRKTSNGWAKL